MAAMLLALTVNLLPISATDSFTLTITVEGQGTTTPPPGIHSYSEGQVVTITAEPAEGYVFYQWEIDGVKMAPHGSPTVKIRMNGNREVKAIFIPREGTGGDKTSGKSSLLIEVVGNGTTHPEPGRYTYSKGSVVLVTAEPAEGYVFYQWEIDGKRVGRNSRMIEVEMNGDHVLRALFVKESLIAPLKSVSPDVNLSVGIGSTAGITRWEFPLNYSIVGGEIDLAFNEDLVSSFGEDGNVTLYLGGPIVIPFEWEDYNVSFLGCSMLVDGQEFNATFGEVDYAAILLEVDGTVRIAGITRYGTRAGLLWLLQEYDVIAGKNLIVLEWIDLNGNGEVEYWEISPILER